jgi:hypothetical protein
VPSEALTPLTGKQAFSYPQLMTATATENVDLRRGRTPRRSARLEPYVEAVTDRLREALGERLAAYSRAGHSLAELGLAEELAQRMLAAVPAPSRWDDLLGPFYDTRGVTRLLGGVSRQAVADRRERRTLLGLKTADGVLVYPAFQFDERGEVISGLAAVLQCFDREAADDWTVGGWLVSKHRGLDGESVVEWLRGGGDPARAEILARDAARRFAQ